MHLCVLLLLLLAADITLLSDGELDTSTLGKGDPGLGSLTDDEDVGKAGSELPSVNVTNVNNVETSDVPLSVDDGTGTAHVATTGAADHVSDLELDEAVDLVDRLDCGGVGCSRGGRGNGGSGEKELDGVVDLDVRVRVSDGPSVVGDDVRDTTSTELNTLDLAELVCTSIEHQLCCPLSATPILLSQLTLGLLLSDAVDGESTLDVVEDTEVLSRLVNGDNVHESGRVGGVGADLSIDLDEPLGGDEGNLVRVQGVLELVAEEDLCNGEDQ